MLKIIRNAIRHTTPVFAAMTLAVAAPAAADPVAYQFSGHLTVAGLLSGSVNPEWQFETNQTFTGTLVYDADQITSAQNLVDEPGWRVDSYVSPIVSLSYTIDLGSGSYTYQAPIDGTHALVSRGDGLGAWNGLELRAHNYPLGDTPMTPVPPEAWVGSYYPHSGFLTLSSDGEMVLPDTSPDIDLAALFASLPATGRQISLRFSDPANWPPGAEHVDGLLIGQIDQFTVAQAAVPEPAMWLALISGMGLAGAALRRRRATLHLA